MQRSVLFFLSPVNTTPRLYFEVMAEEFRKRNYNTIFLALDSDSLLEEVVESFETQNVTFVITTNAFGIDLATNGVSVFEKFKKICFCLIDTPLPKYNQIKAACKYVVVLAADLTFKNIINIINPKLKVLKWFSLGMTGDGSPQKLIKERDIDILFVGRIGDFANALRGWNLIKQLFGKYIAWKFGFQNVKQIDAVVLETINRPFFILINKLFLKIDFKEKKTWDYMWNIVQYIRAKRRNFIIQNLMRLPSWIKLEIITDDVQKAKMKHDNKNDVRILGFKPWLDVLKEMQNAKITINVLPYHVYGNHERIAATQHNGSIVYSDANVYLEELYEDKKDILFYSYDNTDFLKGLDETLKLEHDKLQALASNGKSRSEKLHSSECQINYLLEVYSEIVI